MVCSLLNPQACSEKRFVFEASGSLKSCMMQAQPYLAQWAGEHPDEYLASFSPNVPYRIRSARIS